MKNNNIRYYTFAVILAGLLWGIHQTSIKEYEDISGFAGNMTITSSPEDYKDTIRYKYLGETQALALKIPVWCYRVTGLAPHILVKFHLLIQIIIFVLGIFVITKNLGRGIVTASIATLLIYSSVFSRFGECHLSLSSAYGASASALGVSVGLISFGLFMGGRRVLPMAISALLGCYHPSHCLIQLVFFWGYIALHVRKEGGIRKVAGLALLQALFLIPAIAITLPQQAAMSIKDFAYADMWWRIIELRSTIPFPLNNGLVVVLNVVLTLLCMLLIALFAMKEKRGLLQREAYGILPWLFAWALGLWAVQIVFSHFIPIMNITRMGLGRVMPYVSGTGCVIIAACLVDMKRSSKKFSALILLFFVFFGFLVFKHAPLVAFLAASYAYYLNPAKNRKRLLLTASFAGSLMVLCTVLFHALYVAKIIGDSLWPVVLKAYQGGLLLSYGLTAIFIADAILILLFEGEVSSDSQSPVPDWTAAGYKKASGFALLTLLTLAFNLFVIPQTGLPYDLRLIRSGGGSDDSKLELARWASENTPRGSMFVMPPWSAHSFEIVSHRPIFLQKQEMLGIQYAPGTTREVASRMNLMGVDIFDPKFKTQCSFIKSLLSERCLKNMLYMELTEFYPEKVIENLDRLLKEYPSVRYLMVPESKYENMPGGFETDHPIVYSNTGYRVYDLRSVEKLDVRPYITTPEN